MNRTAYVLLLLTALFWGGNAIAGKLAVAHVSPMLLTTLRWIFTAVLLLAVGWPKLKADWPKLRPRLGLLLLLGAGGFTSFNILLYTALGHTSVINVSIEQAAIPVVIVIANFLLFRTRATWLQLAGIVLTFAGVALVASHGNPSTLLDLDLNVGDAMMLAASAVYSFYTIGLRWKPDVHWQSIMIVLSLAAVVTSLPFAIGEFAVGAGRVPDLRGWAIVAYTVIFPSMASQVFYMKGVELIGPNRAGLFINMVPIFGTLLSITLLGEAFMVYHGLAFAMVLGGIWMAEASGRRVVPQNPG